jgi:hypothetical protein
MPDIDLSDLPEVEGAKKQWRSFIERNQSIVVQVRERDFSGMPVILRSACRQESVAVLPGRNSQMNLVKD